VPPARPDLVTTPKLIPAVLATLPLTALYAVAADALYVASIAVVGWLRAGWMPPLQAGALVSLHLPRLLVAGAALLASAPLLLAAQAVLVEDGGALASLRRSWELTRGARARVALLALIVAALTALLIALPRTLLDVLLPPGGAPRFYQTLADGAVVAGRLFLALCFPFQAAAFTVLYYDLRIRKEAFDLEARQRNLGAD
jgi:hypothetical protein